MPDTEKKYFTRQLMKWNSGKNNREMPWKGETDPYKIWLSEIILQQTRVEQGWAYYERFVKNFPSVEKLAKTPETRVFKLWEGLGYYSRCKNLIATAKQIAGPYKGRFPDTYEEILALKGVGPYTAAAISSFAFQLPHAVVDGNVFRVLSRYFGNHTPTDSSQGKKIFTQLANELLDKKQPGTYNQALMDFGAMVCKPQAPLCQACPLSRHCVAFAKAETALLPVKEKATAVRKRFLYYLVVEHQQKCYVRKRLAGDVWENLYEFVLHEAQGPLSPTKLKSRAFLKDASGCADPELVSISAPLKQQLSHQLINGHIIHVRAGSPPHLPGYKAVSFKQLKKLPFPRLVAAWLAVKNSLPAFER